MLQLEPLSPRRQARVSCGISGYDAKIRRRMTGVHGVSGVQHATGRTRSGWRQQRFRNRNLMNCCPRPGLVNIQYSYFQWQTHEYFQYVENPPSFRTSSNLFKIIEDRLPDVGGPKWNKQSVRLPEAYRDNATLYYRCPRECRDYLFGSAQLAGKITMAPELIYKLDDATEVFGNLFNGWDWDRIQVSLYVVK
jgi:hypothetical protein